MTSLIEVMVRIVDDKPDRSVIKQTVCRNCGSRLEYLPLDVKERHGKDYSGGDDGCRWIDCPKCGKKVILSSW